MQWKKIGGVQNNQQLKYLIQVKDRMSLNLVFFFYFLNCGKTDIPCFFLSGASTGFTTLAYKSE